MEERAYEVRVAGLVHTEDLLDELSDVEVAEHEFRTVLTGHFADQAALHGFLHRLRTFGLEVVEVRRVSTADVSTADVSTADVSTADVSTADVSTAEEVRRGGRTSAVRPGVATREDRPVAPDTTSKDAGTTP